MDLMDTFQITASGLALQRERMNITAENLANINSTRTPEGGPYLRRTAVVSSTPMTFEASLNGYLRNRDVQGARIVEVARDEKAVRKIFDPHHPDADGQGFVSTPDISATQEMVDVMQASRAYEANVTVFNSAKAMVLRSLELGSA